MLGTTRHGQPRATQPAPRASHGEPGYAPDPSRERAHAIDHTADDGSESAPEVPIQDTSPVPEFAQQRPRPLAELAGQGTQPAMASLQTGAGTGREPEPPISRRLPQ